MVELNENNFHETIKEGKWLVMFRRSEGCGLCTQMKPVFEELEGDFQKATYELGPKPDDITRGLVQLFPTFAAYNDGHFLGKQQGVLPIEELPNTFFPERIKQRPQKAPSIKEVSLLQLLTDEAALIDQLGPMRAELNKIQKEIERRKKLATGKIDCCDSCGEGGECDGGCH